MKTIIKYKVFKFDDENFYYIRWIIIKEGKFPSKFNSSLNLRPPKIWNNEIKPFVWLCNKYPVNKYKFEEVK